VAYVAQHLREVGVLTMLNKQVETLINLKSFIFGGDDMVTNSFLV
jgi:hypothetical protein